MSFVLCDEGWAVRCDRCGAQTGRLYPSRAMADLAVIAWGGDSTADESEDVGPDTAHECPDCCAAEG